jgi:hypothetical protein
MKKALVIAATLLALTATPVVAETIETCRSTQYGEHVCGTTTTTTVTHEVVETSANTNELFTIVGSFALAALAATGLYKLTYKSYILG